MASADPKTKNKDNIQRRKRDDGTMAYRAILQRPHPTKPSKRVTESATFDTVRDAKVWLAEKRVEHNRNPRARLDLAKTTFAQLVERWEIVNTWDPNTRSRYEQIVRTHLMPAFAEMKVRDIDRDRVRDYLAALSKSVKPDRYPNGRKNPHAGTPYATGTIEKVHTVLSSVMAEGVNRRIVDANPCHGINRQGRLYGSAGKKDLVILSPDEIHALADTIATLPANPRHPCDRSPYRALILTAAFSGLRASELHELRRRDLDFETGVVRVQRAIKGWKGGDPIIGLPKFNKTRTVAPCAEIMELLTTHLAPGGPPDDLVWVNERGNALRQVPWYRNHFEPARDLALPNHPTYTFHDLRHVFASILIAEGVDIKTVAEQLGHASVAFTIATYGHLMEGRHDKVRAAGSGYFNRRSDSNGKAS